MRTWPQNTNGKMPVKVVSTSGLTEWVDYVTVKVDASGAGRANSYDADGGHIASAVYTGSGSAWVDYVPISVDSTRTVPWEYSSNGYIPVDVGGPFTYVDDWVAPSNFTLGGYWNTLGDGGATGDLGDWATLWPTNPKVDCFCFGATWANSQTDQGQLAAITAGNVLDDRIRGFRASATAGLDGDPTLIAVLFGDTAEVNPVDVGYANDGAYMWCQSSVDTLYTFNTVHPWKPESATPVTSEAKNGAIFSFGGTSDGPVYMTNNGAAVVWVGEDADFNEYVRISTMTTPYDLDTLQAATEHNLSTGALSVTVVNAKMGVSMSEDGTYILFNNNSTCWLGTMSTPYDASTITWDTTNTLTTANVTADNADAEKLWVQPDFQSLWFCYTVDDDAHFFRYDRT